MQRLLRLCFWWLLWLRPVKGPRDFLDTVLFSGADFHYTARDLVAGVLITGATGSGKTTGALENTVSILWKLKCGGMVLCAKPGERERWERIARACGRRVRVIDQTAKWRLNFVRAIDNPRADLPTRAGLIAAGITTVTELTQRGRSGGDEKFWKESSARALRTVVLILLMARIEVTPANIVAVIQSLPASDEAIGTPAFRQGFCCRALVAAHGHQAGYEADYRAARDWVLNEMANLSEKTRSVIVASLTGTLDIATRGVVMRLLGSDTNFSIEAAIEGDEIVLVNFNYSEWMDTAKFVYGCLKHMAQLVALRRVTAPDSKCWPIIIDEYPNCVCEHDFLYVSMSRSSRCLMIVIAQGHESLDAVFPGDNGKSKVQTLIGNLATKIYHLPTPNTAAELVASLGQERTFLTNASTQGGNAYTSPLDLLTGSGSRATGGVSQTFAPILRVAELMRMRCSGGVVDALLVVNGRVFPSTGYNFTKLSFQQLG